MRRGLTSLAFAIALAASGPARGDGDAAPRRLVVARERALWQINEDGSGDPVKLADLGADASTVTRIEPGKGGRYVLVEMGDKLGYAAIGTKPGKLKLTPCKASGRMSPDGRCIGCLDAAGNVAVIRLDNGKVHDLGKIEAREIGFASATELVVVTAGEISSVGLTGAHKRRQLSTEAPAGNLLVAPSGLRAVARYDSGDSSAVYGFKLDGKAVRRKLVGDSVPRAWSPDSAWVVLQSDDRVCVVRAVGGEYKCWEGYVGLAVDAAAEQVLLAKPKGNAGEQELYRAPIAGARATTPVSIATTPAAAGAWLP